MPSRGREGLWVAIGSVVVAAGLALAGLAAFDGDVARTLVGFLIFFAGYWLSKQGVTESSADGAALPPVEPWPFGRLSLVGVGGVLAAVGVTMFADTVVNPDPIQAALSGLSCICGYMSTDVGINGNLL